MADDRGFMLFGTRIPAEGGPPAEAAEERAEVEDQDAREKRTTAGAAALPCPRCRSADTKFCYFNNYNVNQPRHFCKGCQRYWTAGGALRNVPVGAGRRKARSPREGCYVWECCPGPPEEAPAMEQWILLSRQLPTKRPNTGVASRIRR